MTRRIFYVFSCSSYKIQQIRTICALRLDSPFIQQPHQPASCIFGSQALVMIQSSEEKLEVNGTLTLTCTSSRKEYLPHTCMYVCMYIYYIYFNIFTKHNILFCINSLTEITMQSIISFPLVRRQQPEWQQMVIDIHCLILQILRSRKIERFLFVLR